MIESTKRHPEIPHVTLLGGPLHQLGRRLGLVREGNRTLRLGIAIGLGLWLVGAVLAVTGGIDLLSIEMLGAHARLLVAIPLLFACESMLDPRVDAFVRSLVQTRMVPDEQVAALREEIDRHGRRIGSRWAEAACLLGVLAMAWTTARVEIPGTVALASVTPGTDLPWAGWWYAVVCMGVLRFLVLRWLWRWLSWVYLMWRISRLRLRLVASHPDGMAGLGQLDVVHIHLQPLVMAISVVMAASFASDIAAGRMTLEAVYPAIATIVLVDAILFVGPLLLFSGGLWACRVRALTGYTALGARYAFEYERKWLDHDGPRDELMGSPDIQSMADLSGARQVVSDMHSIPVSKRTLSQLLLAALLPMAPLAAFKYPPADLLAQFLAGLVGM